LFRPVLGVEHLDTIVILSHLQPRVGEIVGERREMIALEVECTDKGRRRFLTRLGYLGKVDAISFVLYVAPNDRMVSIVSKYLRDAASDQPAGVVTWAALENGRPQVATVQGAFDLFTKREW